MDPPLPSWRRRSQDGAERQPALTLVFPPGHAQDGGAERPRGRWRGCGEPRKPGHGSAGRTVWRPGRRGARPGRGRFERCLGEAAAVVAAGPRGRRHVPLWRGEPGRGRLFPLSSPPRPSAGACPPPPSPSAGAGGSRAPLWDGGEARGAGAGPGGGEGAPMAEVGTGGAGGHSPRGAARRRGEGLGSRFLKRACRNLTGLGAGAEIGLL